jgi:hypothetical protein
MDFERRYEEFRRDRTDIMPHGWDALTFLQRSMWIALFSRIDNAERETKQAYQIIGKLIALYPDLLPTVEA